jgi:hypothetical protein
LIPPQFLKTSTSKTEGSLQEAVKFPSPPVMAIVYPDAFGYFNVIELPSTSNAIGGRGSDLSSLQDVMHKRERESNKILDRVEMVLIFIMSYILISLLT